MKTNKIFTIFIIAILAITGIVSATISTPTMPSGPTTGIAGTSYGYYTKATDSTGASLRYTIDWGDGSTSTSALMMSGASIKMFHKWAASGSYAIRTKATNTAGLVSAWSAPLQVTVTGGVTPPVNNPPATPSVPSGSASGTSGISYSYSTKATDPDGNQIRYTFEWGDGTTSITSLVSSGTSGSASHSWTIAPGETKTFSVFARATDEVGASSGLSAPLAVVITGPTITNSPPKTPRIPSGSLVGRTTYTYTYKTMANDPDGDMVKYTFDWGDGNTSTTGYVPSGTYASASHKWSGVTPGTFKGFSIKAIATDINGGKSAWSSPLPVSMGAPYVNHRPTSPVISGPTQCNGGTSYEFTIVASDPDANDTLKYLIHWGDYSTETAYYPNGEPVIVEHTWNVPAGKTWTCKIIAVAVDPYQLGNLDWSEPLVVTVTGPSLTSTTAPLIFADELIPEMNENESDYDEVLIEDNESKYENVSP